MPREPWIKVKIGIRRSGKLAALPNDTARLGWFYALVEAKTQHEMGVFASLPHFREVMGRFHRFFNAYLEAGLLEVEPDLCHECGTRYLGLKPGAIVIHDYLREQRSNVPTEEDQPVTPGAKRTAMWRLRQSVFERDNWTCRYCGRADYERDWLIAEHVIPDGATDLENLVTACRGCNKRKGPRMPAQAGMTLLPVPESPADAVTVTRHGDTSQVERDASRDASQQARGPERGPARAPARATTVTVTGTTTERTGTTTSGLDARNGTEPTLSKSQHQAWSSFGPEWDGFKAAWLARGFRLPPSGEMDDPQGQRSLLHSILTERPTDLARWIWSAGGKTTHEVVAWVIAQWHEVQAEVGVDEEPVRRTRPVAAASSGLQRIDLDELPAFLRGEPEPQP